MGVLKQITEGGQVWAHRVRMTKQVLKMALVTFFFVSLLFFGLKTATTVSKIQLQAVGYAFKADTLGSLSETIEVDPLFWKTVTRQSSRQSPLLIKPETVKKVCKPYTQALISQIIANISLSLRAGLFTFFILILFFAFQGWKGRKKNLLQGNQIVPSWKLATRLKLSRKASPIRICSLPFVKNTEVQHTLISGATGSGKTNALHHILFSIRKNGQRAIIVDSSGELLEKYYREGKDTILNPFDSRSVPWHPWCEGLEKEDLKVLATGFVPSSSRDEENFWRKGAQEVLFAALQETAQEKRTSSLTRLLLHETLPVLSKILEGSSATAYMDTSSEKTAGSIRAVLAGFTECLELLKDTETPFSIKEWVQKDTTDGWLFLNSTVKQRASLIPLLSVWVTIATQGLVEMPRNPNRRLWFIMDELPRLNKISTLESFVTESRKYGGCGLFAIQSPAQLEEIYGRGATKTIIGNIGTRIAFAENDPQVAKLISLGFGEKQVKESQESISYGAHEMRDGVNLSFQTRYVPCVSSSDIQSLKINQAFLKFPGGMPITKMRVKLFEA